MSAKFLKIVTGIIKDSNFILSGVDRRSLKIDDNPVVKLRYIVSKLYRKMSQLNTEESVMLVPPPAVRGMTQLQKEAFARSVKIPGLKVPKKEISRSQKTWKPLVLKLPGLKPVAELSDKDPLRDSHSLILLDPQKLREKSFQPEQLEMLKKFGLDLEKPDNFEVELSYENWSVADVLRAVLPSEVDNVTSYTQVGHIAHLNLKQETLPFKHLIGEVILDKVSSVKTVVNKLNSIDNTYRNFSMELLAGEDNFVTQTKEHNCVFELDFSKVYWNSRLATEHQRIVDFVPKESVVYDVFAGIGPFSIPLAKKKRCTVFANDLNPASYESLNKNIGLNSIKQGSVKSWNLDGKDFILTVVKNNLEERIKHFTENNSSLSVHTTLESNGLSTCEAAPDLQVSSLSEEQTKGDGGSDKSVTPSYVIMNLPAIAVEFLSVFHSLLHNSSPSVVSALRNNPEARRSLLPQVFCYAFSPKTDIDTELRKRVEAYLGCNVPADYSARLVRNVAPNKEMICISFRLWPELLLSPPSESDALSPANLPDDGRKRECYTEVNVETGSKKQKLATDLG